MVNQTIRLLRKLAGLSQVADCASAQNRSVHEVHEDSSTAATGQLAKPIEFPKKSIVGIQWLKYLSKAVLMLMMLFLLFNYALASTNWRVLAKGIEYQDLEDSYLSPWSHIHVFRIDLKSNDFSLIMAKDLAVKYASVDEYAQHSQALISINGGFFDKNFTPLGLRITNKHIENPIKLISWWGVFSIKNNQAHITSARQFKRDNQIDFAVQSGPRLLINGQIPPLKAGRAERSALGITQDGKVIILVTDNEALSTTELAQKMKASPLYCINALNLDGGSSSQLHAQVGSFTLNVHGFANVSDSIVVKAKP